MCGYREYFFLALHDIDYYEYDDDDADSGGGDGGGGGIGDGAGGDGEMMRREVGQMRVLPRSSPQQGEQGAAGAPPYRRLRIPALERYGPPLQKDPAVGTHTFCDGVAFSPDTRLLVKPPA